MRSKDEIMEDVLEATEEENFDPNIMLEILLDIRELLINMSTSSVTPKKRR